MSYRPPRPGKGGYVPPAGPSSYNVSGVRVRGRSRGAGIPWVIGCGLLLLGMIVGAVGLFLLALFWFGSPASNQPLPRSEAKGTADLSATLSEDYLNATLNKYLKESPVNLGGIANVKDVVLKIQPNQRVDVTLRLGNSFIDFDIGVTEALGVKQNKLVLVPVGQPRVGKGNLPVGADKVVELANSTLIEPEINKSLAQVKIDNRPFVLVDTATAAGLITIRFNAQ